MKLLSYVHLRNIHRSTGAGRVARQLTEHLSAMPGTELRVLADRSDHERTIGHVGAPWTTFRYHFFRDDTSRQQARWFFLGAPRAEAYWPEAQLVHCTAESYVPTRRARLAVTVHDAAIFESGAHAANAALWKQRLKWKLLYQALSRRADLFHTVSQFSADRLATYFPSIRSRLRVVYNAVCPRLFEPPSAEGDAYLQEHGLLGRDFALLPGGLHFRKNAELVLAAWPRLHEKFPDLKLVIVNHSNPAYLERARALGESVHVAGFVDDEPLCSLYHRARVVWFPSRYEGFGLPVLEAMASGTPTVASDSSSLPEIAGGASILVPPDQPGKHVEALEHLLRSQSAAGALSLRGRKRSREFTWQRSAAELHQQFASIL